MFFHGTCDGPRGGGEQMAPSLTIRGAPESIIQLLYQYWFLNYGSLNSKKKKKTHVLTVPDLVTYF